ncbi:MAG: hemerythrin family protein [Magnetospirillum sp.]|nr:hemerythrin family protein [Magnetospirillum sp.]
MDMLVWEEGYKIGHREMDSQHLILFSLLNQLDININNGMARECVADVLGALGSYIEYHFSHEEQLMAEYGYPGLENHCSAHRAFIAQIDRLQESAASGGTLAAALKIRGFVLDWLLGHILDTDVDYARFIAAAAKS